MTDNQIKGNRWQPPFKDNLCEYCNRGIWGWFLVSLHSVLQNIYNEVEMNWGESVESPIWCTHFGILPHAVSVILSVVEGSTSESIIKMFRLLDSSTP